MRWQDLFAALALMLVFEGILPFIKPHLAKVAYASISQLEEHALRLGGLISMLAGVLLLYLVNWFA